MPKPTSKLLELAKAIDLKKFKDFEIADLQDQQSAYCARQMAIVVNEIEFKEPLAKYIKENQFYIPACFSQGYVNLEFLAKDLKKYINDPNLKNQLSELIVYPNDFESKCKKQFDKVTQTKKYKKLDTQIKALQEQNQKRVEEQRDQVLDYDTKIKELKRQQSSEIPQTENYKAFDKKITELEAEKQQTLYQDVPEVKQFLDELAKLHQESYDRFRFRASVIGSAFGADRVQDEHVKDFSIFKKEITPELIAKLEKVAGSEVVKIHGEDAYKIISLAISLAFVKTYSETQEQFHISLQEVLGTFSKKRDTIEAAVNQLSQHINDFITTKKNIETFLFKFSDPQTITPEERSKAFLTLAHENYEKFLNDAAFRNLLKAAHLYLAKQTRDNVAINPDFQNNLQTLDMFYHALKQKQAQGIVAEFKAKAKEFSEKKTELEERADYFKAKGKTLREQVNRSLAQKYSKAADSANKLAEDLDTENQTFFSTPYVDKSLEELNKFKEKQINTLEQAEEGPLADHREIISMIGYAIHKISCFGGIGIVMGYVNLIITGGRQFLWFSTNTSKLIDRAADTFDSMAPAGTPTNGNTG